MSSPIVLAPEVASALAEGQAVVALESTIIAHGMPYPQNLETALRVEQTVRQAGAVPATCAVVSGKLRAGLSAEELEHFAQKGRSIAKASRRDLGYLVSRGLDGATTVAATMIIAHLADIRCFATGGIGGVHRGAPATFDISADLQELAHTPVAVVCAGAKSILDLGLTLEYLETFGVPVLGYQTDEFPAFYARTSGLQVDYRMDSPEAIARLLRAHWGIGLRSGVVVANPVPEPYALDAKAMEEILAQAIAEAERQHIRGKALTPFLLARIEQLTGGLSLKANIELVCNNARLAAQIARALADEQPRRLENTPEKGAPQRR
ncbi:MAG: pseudouridine-5'-phosphate glycosidase [Saprospiraceae bacterium]|nr:pseudouridine-5'-phosphate glycosidase [Saprospiraceae bacterium]MDW8229957.1 pseudouridine-5'-phosphate glycosidase [Saprospiraceae bacterium]